MKKVRRKATRESKILKNESKDTNSNFPPVRLKELLWEEKGWLTDFAHNLWWHMKCTQHAAHIRKDGIVQTSAVVAIKRLNDKVAGSVDDEGVVSVDEVIGGFVYIWYKLQWRHNGCDGVLNHQPHHCLLNRLFRRR